VFSSEEGNDAWGRERNKEFINEKFGTRPLGRRCRRGEDNIKTDLKKM
jgi:hypothetical protein